MDAGGAEDLGQGILDDGGLDQVMLGDIQVSVVLEHARELHAGVAGPVKLVKVLPVEGQGDLLGPVAPEVEEDDAVPVFDLGNRSAVSRHHKCGQILVDAAGLGPVGFNGLLRGGEHPALALNMGAPALFHHGPVGLIPVHGDLHTAAAGGDGIVAAVGAQLRKNLLQYIHILKSGGGGHVPAVQQDVAVGLLHAILLCLAQQGDEVGDVRVDVAVGQQSQKVHGLAANRVGGELLPGLGLEESAVFDGLAHQLGSLGVDLAAAQGVMSHLGVAHIVVGGQADGGAVGLEVGVGAGFQQAVQGGGVGDLHGIAAAAVALADAVHDHKNNGFFHMCTSVM